MPSEKSGLKSELLSICETIRTTKSTCSMYSFQSTVDKCLTDKKILNREVIVECLSILTNLMPSKLLDDLFSKAIELNDTEMCFSLINNVQILEERHAVECIKFFLKDLKEDEILSDQSQTARATTDKNLNLLFTKSYDYRLFTSELKKLSSKEFLYLQIFLKELFNKKNITPDLSRSNLNNTQEISSQLPSVQQVVDLFCCFVDAHFTHITLSDKGQELIADALQLIETQLELYFEYLSIESLLKEYKNNKEFQIKANNNVGIYSIEVLKF